MKNTRILLIAIPVVIIFSAIIGCALTYGSAPHAALARIFIDIGALIALVSITYTLPKPEKTNTDDIVDGLRDLAKNRFDRRLVLKDHDELFQVRQAFNELAGTLSDSRDPSLTHIRYNPMHRVELKVTPLPMVNHSHHPELGQVRSAPDIKSISTPPAAVITYPDPRPDPDAFSEEEFSDHAFEQAPRVPELDMQAEEASTSLVSEPTPMQEPVLASAPEPLPEPEHEPEPELVDQARPETYPSDIGAADLFFLFERFKAAHERPEDTNLDFDTFLSSVMKAREDLIRAHQCRDVKFEVVSDAGAVALRPRLVR